MLPDHVTQLLTAYVDGELGPRQRKAVMRLLHQSSEAREFLRQLQENAHRIKQLPRRKVEPSLVDEIVAAIAAQKIQPKQPVQPRLARSRWRPYVAASLAASLLFGTIGIVYWKSMEKDGDNKTIAKVPPEKKPEPRPAPEPEPSPSARKAPDPKLVRIVEDTFIAFSAPIPEEKIFTASFGELRNEGKKTAELTYELRRDKIVQLEVTVKNNTTAMERLKAALHEQGIKTVVDPDASKSLTKKSQAKIEYWVYAENVTADELTKILRDLSNSDNSGMGGTVPSPYEKLKVAPLPRNEKQKIGELLKIDSNKESKGSAPGPVPQRWERSAVVLPVSPNVRPSQEVRQVGEKRVRPQADAVQVLIKIRQE